MFADDAESLKKSKTSKSSFIHGFINLLYIFKNTNTTIFEC